ncbi:MAG: GFA family protein [Reyranella sp.]
MTSSDQREAACACGQLRIRLAGEPRLVSSCHCFACQRRTGAVFGSTSFFGRDQVVAIEGERRAFRRQGDSGTWLTFQFCPICGSSVFWESERSPNMVSVAVGAFADPTFPAPVRTVWTASMHEWLPFPEDIVRHRENPT